MIQNISYLLDRLYSDLAAFTDIAVLGMSGGVDSSLVATLCAGALGPENVVSLHMPYSRGDWEKFNSRSWSLAEKLKIKSYEVSCKDVADEISNALCQGGIDCVNVKTQLNAGNARSRARMCLLYGASHAIAQANSGKRVRVIGTGNLSEDYIGYDTKGGDALADLFPIGELYKSEVYQLLEHFRDQGILDEEHIDRVPSAGLWDGQTDEQELGYTYNDMQPVIEKQRSGAHVLDNDLTRFVFFRHLENKHKHLAPPVIPLREYCK